MQKDMISVVIPTYNREKLIVKSIKSVLAQTYKNIEVIVVDDCSKDNTEKKVKAIKDKRLKYIKLEKNSGACTARNIGIEKAKGEYIAFQDSDDIFYKEKLEEQLNNMKKNDSDLDFCRLKVHVDGNIYDFPGIEEEKKIKKYGLLNQLCEGNLISTQTILVKSEVLENIMFDPLLPRFQDYDFVLQVADKYKITHTNKFLVDVYRRDDSISKSDEKLKKACLIMLQKDYSLTKEQKNKLTETLLYWYSKNESDKYSTLLNDYNNLKKEYTNFINDYKTLNKENKKISQQYQDLINNYNELEKQHRIVIESKRWKILNKILKIFRK